MSIKLKSSQTTHSSYHSLSLWVLIYAFSYAFFHIIPVLLHYEIKNRLMVGDLFDILTPFAIVLVAYKIFRILSSGASQDSDSSARTLAIGILILGAITFVEGHGMHLSANAIARHLAPMKGSPLFTLDYFFDEKLGHILWDSGIALLSFGLILMGSNFNQARALNQKPILTIFASLLYGFTYFVNAVEGQTAFFTFPLAIVIPFFIWCLVRRRRILLLKNPVLSFYLLAHLLALPLFIIWGIWHGGFPEFSELGWI